MSLVVQKYGGSSVADVDKLKKIASMIAAVKKQGIDVVVVVSAMGKTTNQHIEMAKAISSDPPRREMDMLLSTGERTSMALLCIALHEEGIESISLTGSQAGIITNYRHNDARVIEVRRGSRTSTRRGSERCLAPQPGARTSRPGQGHPMRLDRTFIVLIAGLVAGCAFVKYTEAGARVRVATEHAVASCERIGTASATTKERLLLPRVDSKVKSELDTLACNEAAAMGGDPSCPMGPALKALSSTSSIGANSGRRDQGSSRF